MPCKGWFTILHLRCPPESLLTKIWLPAPKGDSLPISRMYWPKDKSPSIIDGTWIIPAVQKVK